MESQQDGVERLREKKKQNQRDPATNPQNRQTLQLGGKGVKQWCEKKLSPPTLLDAHLQAPGSAQIWNSPSGKSGAISKHARTIAPVQVFVPGIKFTLTGSACKVPG